MKINEVMSTNYRFEDGQLSFNSVQLTEQINIVYDHLNIPPIVHDVVKERIYDMVDNYILPLEQYYGSEDGVLWIDHSLCTRAISYMQPVAIPYLTHCLNIAMWGHDPKYLKFMLNTTVQTHWTMLK